MVVLPSASRTGSAVDGMATEPDQVGSSWAKASTGIVLATASRSVTDPAAWSTWVPRPLIRTSVDAACCQQV